MLGRTGGGGQRRQELPGNRPTTSIVLLRLTPRALAAWWAHGTIFTCVVWDVNSFDQMGVELGKEPAAAAGEVQRGEPEAGAHDASTAGLLRAINGAGERRVAFLGGRNSDNTHPVPFMQAS